ncbi:MAG: sigma 54-interacting transcriptional regulator [Bdellovibrionia bacterium]
MEISKDLVKLFHLASRGESTVLLTGETGTGKTYWARKIHEASKRSAKPFVVVNLATLHGGTLESELFGHERGAFTGADLRRVGKLEMAQGGTVFLDEVGELSLALQARLLEFLQSRTISPVGSNRVSKLDVRVIAATHRNLVQAVQQGSFREDLFHRLRVISIPMKSLRQRKSEWRALLEATLEEFCQLSGRTALRVSASVSEILETYAWPGNLRELRNVIEYSVQSAEGSEIQVQDLPSWLLDAVMNQEPLEPLSSMGSVPLNSSLVSSHFTSSVSSSSSFSSSSSSSLPSQEGKEQADDSCGVDDGVPELGVLSLPLALDYRLSKTQFEREFLKRALLKNGGRINQTARQIGVNKSTLIRRMQSLGLKSSVSVVIQF